MPSRQAAPTLILRSRTCPILCPSPLACPCFSLPGASALQAEPETLPSGNFLLWQPEQRPAGFSHMDRIFPTRVVKAGAIPVPSRAPHELAVRYTVDARPMDTTGFMPPTMSPGCW
jgi:hypothetical protein